MSASLVCQGVGTLVLPWWPDTVTRSGGIRQWTEQGRPGDYPLLLSEGLSLEEYQISYLARGRDLRESVSAHMELLDRIKVSEIPVVLMLEGSNRGLFHLTEVSVAESTHNTAGEPTSCDVSATLKRASEATVNVGPIPAKKNTMPASKKKKAKKKAKGSGSAGA